MNREPCKSYKCVYSIWNQGCSGCSGSRDFTGISLIETTRHYIEAWTCCHKNINFIFTTLVRKILFPAWENQIHIFKPTVIFFYYVDKSRLPFSSVWKQEITSSISSSEDMKKMPLRCIFNGASNQANYGQITVQTVMFYCSLRYVWCQVGVAAQSVLTPIPPPVHPSHTGTLWATYLPSPGLGLRFG